MKERREQRRKKEESHATKIHNNLNGLEKKFNICDGICENRPHCTRYRNRDSAMNDVIEVWSRSGENLEAIACIVLEIRSLEARRVG